ncbi:MAG: xanthine dehydrogenase family protein molybdopterin-binding subunit [Dehalococcoidia bacterium]|jgi:carbon-monoxide dehydrogenase large subunit|nr:xanthine dehydrogenase family protein molybdopterin-binding subunit [Dehalococcoidia bacterium]
MTYLGQSLKRAEDPRLITGQGSFVDDINLPGMLHVAVLRSPHAHARVKSIDTAAASSAPGVVAVLTAEDIEGVLQHVPTGISVYEGKFDHLEAPEHPVLARGKVCYVGQPVAMVVAQDPNLARDALELIQTDYEPLAPILDPLEIVNKDTIPIHDEVGTNLGLRVRHQGGDLDAAFGQADRVIRQSYHLQRLAPAPMEARGVAADYRREEKLLTVWDSTQRPHWVRRFLAQILNLPENEIRVLAQDVGGGFGEKGCVFPEEIAIPYLSLSLGRPVKWVEDRQENMITFHGRGHTAEVAAAVKSDGTILGMRVRIYVDLGAYFYLSTPAAPTLASERLPGPYKTPAMDVEVLGVITNRAPTGAYRGAGGPEAAFSVERTVDLIAQELGLDPAEVRRKNLIQPDAFPYDTPTGITYDSGNYQKVFDRALELADYPAWRERSKQGNQPNEPLIGVGLAAVTKGSGAHGERRTDHARVVIDESGLVSVYSGVSPHGQGTETTFTQIVSDELGVTPSDVEMFHSDTQLFPVGGGTGASRGITVGGSTVYTVLQDAREKLVRIAAHLLECPPADVEMREGRVFRKGTPSSSIPFSQVAAAAYDEELLPPDVEPGLEFNATYTLPDNPYAFGTHVVVVEVDRDNGAVKILKYVAVHDAGRILNPMLAEGQIHGGLAQGLGQALMEGMEFTPEGQPLTGSFMDYAMPKAQDMPDLTLDTFETLSPLNPLGAKGIGELPTVAAPAAITNAVMDALYSTGVRHIDTPLTPEKIWRALNP